MLKKPCLFPAESKKPPFHVKRRLFAGLMNVLHLPATAAVRPDGVKREWHGSHSSGGALSGRGQDGVSCGSGSARYGARRFQMPEKK